MNAAARLMQQSGSGLSRVWVIGVALSRVQLLTLSLVSAVLMTSLSLIYVTNTARNLQAGIQETLAERNQLHVQWGQLLLEKGTWTMQARVENVAEQQMNMMVPDHKSVVIVNE